MIQNIEVVFPNPPRENHAPHAKFMRVSPLMLTKKHAYQTDADSQVLSYQLRDQAGVSHESILEAEHYVLLAYQL